LGAFVQQHGANLGVEVLVPDLDRVFGGNANTYYVMGSTFKIPLLFTLLSQSEANHVALTPAQQQDAQVMIEQSDNDAEGRIYAETGYEKGVTTFLQSLGITGFQWGPDYIGNSSITPEAMVAILAAFSSGKILNANDRAFAQNLMSNIDPTQSFGIGQTAPLDATAFYKDGWLQDDQGVWTVGTVGVVARGGHTFIIAGYETRDNDFYDGWTILDDACTAIMESLPSGP
jgi:beta-lactamase class A